MVRPESQKKAEGKAGYQIPESPQNGPGLPAAEDQGTESSLGRTRTRSSILENELMTG